MTEHTLPTRTVPRMNAVDPTRRPLVTVSELPNPVELRTDTVLLTITFAPSDVFPDTAIEPAIDAMPESFASSLIEHIPPMITGPFTDSDELETVGAHIDKVLPNRTAALTDRLLP